MYKRQDLFLLVEVQPHSQFDRQGDDLYLRLPLPLTTLILGGDASVPTLEGSLTLSIPPETQNARRFRLRGKGMPRLGSVERGDLFVTVEPQIPTGLSDAQRELFTKLRALGC